MLLDGRVHVLSWVKDSVSENTEYRCSFISKAGNATSKVLITVEDEGRLVSSVCCVSLTLIWVKLCNSHP